MKDKIKNLDGKMAALKGASLNDYPRYHLRCFENFREWAEYASNTKNPDEARHALYYVFQPLYDIVLTKKMMRSRRKKAVNALNDVIETGKKYLSGYYLGSPDVRLINKLSDRINGFVCSFKSDQYYYKRRNVDTNDVYPRCIGKFLQCYLEKISSDGNEMPDVVVGCACGASEIAMSLAGILDAELVFARRSKRRDDEEAKIVGEHEKMLPSLIKGKNVVVIEDYVCSGGSLRDVLMKVEEYKPKKSVGASVMSCYDGDHSSLTVNDHKSKFNTFNFDKNKKDE